jgi:predicted CoA-binding protein
MSNRDLLLNELTLLANGRIYVALFWHVVLYAALAWAMLSRRGPARSAVALLLLTPVVSATTLAWLRGDLAHALWLTALIAALSVVTIHLPSTPPERTHGWRAWLGWAALALAASYPHYVQVEHASAYLLYAPLGVLPAPTLALLLGASLLLGGLGSRAWSYAVSACAFGVGVLGAFVLEVWIDLALVVAALALLGTAAGTRPIPAALASERARIDAFLALRRVALVGASRHETALSRLIMDQLRARGVHVIPVHPTAPVIGDQLAYPDVAALAGRVDGALIMTPPQATAQVVESCASAGIRSIWLHRGLGGSGAVSRAALESCARHGLDVIAGRCPLMFLEPQRFSVHCAHASVERLRGQYPERASES